MELKQYLSIACLLLVACNSNKEKEHTMSQPKKLQELKWMLGDWRNITPQGTFSETWQVVSDSVWKGEGRMTDSTGKVLFAEQLELIVKADTVWYVPIVANQNSGQPVQFMQTAVSDTSVVFENLKHDFPQRIVYYKTSGNTLYAYVEGKENGKMRKEEFSYTKVN